MDDYITRRDAVKALWIGQFTATLLYGRTKVADTATEESVKAIVEIPSADVVEVVRCKDCVHYLGLAECELLENKCGGTMFFCMYGERGEDAEIH